MSREQLNRYVVNVQGVILRDGDVLSGGGKGEKGEPEILIIKRSEDEDMAPGILSFPGGKVEIRKPVNDDALLRTLCREIAEEVDVEIEDEVRYVESTVFSLDWDPRVEWVLDVVFLCKHLEGKPDSDSCPEVAWCRWMSFEEILTNDMTPPWTARTVKKVAEMLD